MNRLVESLPVFFLFFHKKSCLFCRKGFNESSECFTSWDDKYLKTTYGHLKIEVTTKKPGKVVEPQIMTMKKFLLRLAEFRISNLSRHRLRNHFKVYNPFLNFLLLLLADKYSHNFLFYCYRSFRIKSFLNSLFS